MAANYSIVIMGSETVIFDAYGNKIISCPTEQEAVEHINELEIIKDFDTRIGCDDGLL